MNKSFVVIVKAIAFIIFVLLFLGCDEKQKIELPPITSSGENTMGCLIDGRIFIANYSSIFDPAVQADYIPLFNRYNADYLSLTGFSKNETIGISLVNATIRTNSSYILNDSLNDGWYYDREMIIDYYSNSSYTGEIFIIKLDTINYIISGTFWFDAVSEDGELVEIRDGRFDIVY
ncbi:MAG: hypothetical protein JXB49_14690 [Bacteroidales bacterium]|nr:hypothetical protein [Bacteroidales bacterium]